MKVSCWEGTPDRADSYESMGTRKSLFSIYLHVGKIKSERSVLIHRRVPYLTSEMAAGNPKLIFQMSEFYLTKRLVVSCGLKCCFSPRNVDFHLSRKVIHFTSYWRNYFHRVPHKLIHFITFNTSFIRKFFFTYFYVVFLWRLLKHSRHNFSASDIFWASIGVSDLISIG